MRRSATTLFGTADIRRRFLAAIGERRADAVHRRMIVLAVLMQDFTGGDRRPETRLALHGFVFTLAGPELLRCGPVLAVVSVAVVSISDAGGGNFRVVSGGKCHGDVGNGARVASVTGLKHNVSGRYSVCTRDRVLYVLVRYGTEFGTDGGTASFPNFVPYHIATRTPYRTGTYTTRGGVGTTRSTVRLSLPDLKLAGKDL